MLGGASMKLGFSIPFAGLVCAGLAFTASNAGEKKNPATTAMNRDVARHKQFLAIAKKGDVDVLFLGDSITNGWEGQKGWKSHFAPLKAANFGIGGDQTGHALWRL